MKTATKNIETLIIRSRVIPSLYDVVKVNFDSEDIEFLGKNLTFIDAQSMLGVAEDDLHKDEQTNIDSHFELA